MVRVVVGLGMRWFLLLLTGCVASVETAGPTIESRPGAVADADWPGLGVQLDLLIPPSAQVQRPIRVFLDPGHGTGRNHGNQGVRCQPESDVMLELADDLARRMGSYGTFEIRSARPAGERTPYNARVSRADSWDADVFLSLHSDARGVQDSWEPFPSWACTRNDDQPGFAILVSDEGSDTRVEERARLANAVARRMSQAGFGAYDGVDYGTLYDPGEVAGTFLDRRGLLMLRRPTMPSVIIETHHAWDLNEVRRWDEERTRDAFARAVAHAVLDVVRE